MIRQLIALGLMMLMAACSSTPSPKKVAHIHEIHGHKRADNYNWMKDPTRKNPDVIDHLNDENRYTDGYMRSVKHIQGKLYDEIVGRVQQTDSNVPAFKNGFFYYSRTERGKDFPIYCRRKGNMEAPEEIILDLNEVAKGKKNISLGSLHMSPDQTILAYTLDEAGSEIFTLHFKDLNSGKYFVDKVEKVTPNFVWANDNRTVFFTRMSESYRPFQVFRYQLAGKGEALVYEDPNPAFGLGVYRSQDDRYLFMGTESFSSSEYYYLPADKPQGQWRVIQKRQPGLEYQPEHHNGWFYIRNNQNATNFKVSRAPVQNPAIEKWVDFIAHNDEALIDDIVIQKERLIYRETREALGRIRYVNFKTGGRYEINFDEPVYDVTFGDNPDHNAGFVRLHFESPVTPLIVYDFDFAKREFFTRKKQEVPNYNPALYNTKRLLVQSRDGQKIPVTVLFKSDFKQDGTAPCLLFGYGAYGLTQAPSFRSEIFSLIDRGFVFAIAHVRGGQAKGRSWYNDGKLFNKMNTFNDFIDVARGLIASRYTSADRLAIRGRSAGGLLMGAVINKRPDLFRAVVAQVPFVDTLSTVLDPNLRFSTQEYLQWGNPNELAPYEYILSYSPYDQIAEKEYPTIMAITGFHDSRVNYWEPAKWVAKLRDHNKSDNDIILRTYMDGGHKESARYKAFKEEAEIQAFLLKALEIDD